MSFFNKKSTLIMSVMFLALVVLPVTIFLFQQRQETRSRAEKTVVLSYLPSYTNDAPMQIPAGSTFSLDVYVDPGSSSVSFVKAEMLYDSTKFEVAGGFITNQEVFSQIVEGPVNQTGKTTVALSIGSDLKKALRQKTKVGTLTLKALSTVPANATSSISFGTNSQALAVSDNASYNENVIAGTQPVSVKFNKANLTCGTSPMDALLVMDRSGSMNERDVPSGTKISNAKRAATNFVDIMGQEESNMSALTTFASNATLNSVFTSDFATVKNQINSISANGETCIECGIKNANQEIAAHKRAGFKNIVILLTDGEANYVEGGRSKASRSTAEQRALAAAQAGHSTNGTIYYTIGLGRDVNSQFLTKLAEDSGGQYYYSPTSDQLYEIYIQISQVLAKGSISGSVFNDANGNGVLDTSEPKLPGWDLQMFKLNNGTQISQIISTDSTGSYALTNLCDGTYTMKEISQSGWKQTMPSDPRGYTFNIVNGNAIVDKHFGNTKVNRCSDGIDNDGNGAIDRADSTCHTDGNPNNPGSYDPNRDGERGNSTCSDSKDNNGNVFIDGEDPVCHVDGNAGNPSSYDPTRSEVTPTATPTPSPTITPSPTPTAVPTATVAPTQVPTVTAAPTPTPTQVLTPTPTPNGTRMTVKAQLHGIGSSGDNANPIASSLSNKNPLHPQRRATATLFDTSNNIIATAAGDIVYSSASGDYTGTLYVGTFIDEGNYSIKVRTDNHLTRLVGGIINLLNNQTNIIPSVQVVAGDANNDNRLDILDYNLLLDCYSDLDAAADCDDTKKLNTDANDDGNVNQYDYNLFLREISTQPGE